LPPRHLLAKLDYIANRAWSAHRMDGNHQY
jgi:hypothetical protein